MPSTQLDEHGAAVVELRPYTVILKDGQTVATIYPVQRVHDVPVGLLAFLCDEFNAEIDRGDTLPFFEPQAMQQFQEYWFSGVAGVMLIGNHASLSLDDRRQWEKECLGTFTVSPRYPGRCAHICTASFLVNAGIRRQGIGRTLAETFLDWAAKLGYNYAVFDLVFESNVAARRIWESLGFKRIGRIKGAGILKGHESAVDALMYGREIVESPDEPIGELRFDRIKFYLETGRYPPHSDRQEKSRLRSSAAHYRLRDGRLMLKDREVVPEPGRQLQIASELHAQSHAGINKTTSQITEKYHWTRIKETVAQAIRNCAECRETTRQPPKRQKKGGSDYSLAAAAAAVAAAPQPHPSHHLMRGGPLQQPHGGHGMGGVSHDDINSLYQQQNSGSFNRLSHDPSLLGTDLANLDESLLAAVQNAAKGGRSGNAGSSNNQGNRNEDIPVDPQVESAFDDHVTNSSNANQNDSSGNGEEIAIARALINANDHQSQN
ncbi:protein Spt10p [Trichomonascus vanleenenianus]|uniref:Spt10p n=1 Tax=Trichomonascus vanleenenianus TaxID=2268995 RepID=UPI003EC9CEAC